MKLQTLERHHDNPPVTQVRGSDPSANIVVVVLILAFVALSVVCFHRVGPTGLDSVLLHGYRPNRVSVLFRVANVLTGFGSPGAVVVLGCVAAALVWWRFRSTVWAVACVLAPGLAGISEATLKVIVGRSRPVAAALTGEAATGFRRATRPGSPPWCSSSRSHCLTCGVVTRIEIVRY